MPTAAFTWIEPKQDPRAAQLVKIGDSLVVGFGATADDIAHWKYGAALNDYLQTRLIPAIRDFSAAATAARDELQLDKTVAPFVLPVFAVPAPPVAPAGLAPLDTDFLEWCDTLYKKMKLNGLSDSQSKNLGFLVPTSTPATPIGDLQPRIISIDTQPGGKVVVTTTRDDQKMVHAQITLDTGPKLDKTLPNTKFTFDLPTDRVHGLEVRAIYADKDGNDIGQWSDIKTDSSEV